MATEGEILIPFAVHTAKFGYDWSNVPEGMSREELDACYRAAIVRKPEYLEVGRVISGVAEAGGRKFAFSIQVAEAWDANGRNAEYGAFAFAPAIVAERLDMERLLAREEFRTPSRTPPKGIACGFVAAATSESSGDGVSAAPEGSVPLALPVGQSRRDDDGEIDWLSVLIWAFSAIAAIVAIVAACR